MGKLFKAITAVAPGPIAVWAGDVLQVFDRTFVIRPNSPEILPNTAAAVGTILTIFVTAIHFNAAPATLKRRALWAGSAAALVLIAIFVIRAFLDGAIPRRTAIILYRVYDVSSSIFLVLVIVTVVFAILYQFNSSGDDQTEPAQD
ncbi:hypothetical protein J2Z31_003601 [Sinorhizobium kostiense]|uniref:Transmembrane protein n=1 Tax=Sinorhizobium kostiense TaxID=76747 RepID=A0ABS4R2F8_9HYPH|nr:hypothetical protein [Sinorhizobium kostiense]MBP2237087.1 hypothetical protein [Sinorhizobium kostiense]